MTTVDEIKYIQGLQKDMSFSDRAWLRCCLEGKTDRVKEMLANGHDVEAKNTYGVTGLMLAVTKLQYDTVAALLEAGADVNYCLKGKTCLDDAADVSPVSGKDVRLVVQQMINQLVAAGAKTGKELETGVHEDYVWGGQYRFPKDGELREHRWAWSESQKRWVPPDAEQVGYYGMVHSGN
eukprot:gnl/MRDRNA2_/MRDRNA2_101763_c0_seq1.p1 gnl/MRDRNA2_/MRDRNA2_101763_c0~~gnl/MRDRNA2_/MRDRNA2_101763_c0_seq1.p1  ORF type:complete len:180 (+),score=44.74 gnl/MRDRNA2_/MRDRNA2_101763_c0_seq1:85-624(+)